MSALDIQAYETDTADARGRVNIGASRGDADVTYVVLDPDTLDRLDGPNTKSVYSDGRLALGSDFAGEEVTVGLVSVSK